MVLLAGLLSSPAHAVEVITNGGFESGGFNGWNVGIRPDRANGGAPSLFDTPSGWAVSKETQTDGALSLSPVSGFSAFHGFSGNPAGLQFFLSQPFACNNLVSRAKLSFTYDVVGGPQTPNALPRKFEVWIRSTSGFDRAKLFSYSVLGIDANPPQTVSLDIRSAFNSLGPTQYLLEFRGVVPEGDTGPALFVVDNVSLDLQDNRSPRVVCPGDKMVECAGPVTTVTLAASASDPDGDPLSLVWTKGNVIVGNGPTLTIALPPGKHTFTFMATDVFGAMAMCDVMVTITGAALPKLTCPPLVCLPAEAGKCGRTINYPAPTVESCLPIASLTCVPASGFFFPVGTTTVTCTATDSAGNKGTCTFPVIILDSEAPKITCPSNITVPAQTGVCGAIVSYAAPATDNCPGVTTVCTPPSGSTFPFGTTTVTCTATDASGNKATCSFTVTVTGSPDGQITPPVCHNIVGSVPEGQPCYPVTFNIDLPPGLMILRCVDETGRQVSSGSCFTANVLHTVTCTFVDACGRTTTCTFTIHLFC
jgi:hypothetical protein